MRRRYLVPRIASSEITSESAYLNRREFVRAVGLAAVPALAPISLSTNAAVGRETHALNYSQASSEKDGFLTGEQQTPLSAVTTYGNFYEFGTEKSDPGNFAQEMSIDPWSLEVDGEVHKPAKLHLEDLLSAFALQERIYRLRCVEGWSMVIPWVGIPLAEFLQRFEPTGAAKYVAFETLFRREEMRGALSFTSIIDWPYREGLRIDEAMHPLTLLAVGLYGKTLPNQNGAPIRLVVPWKYGFKSIKSIVRIHLQDKQPVTSWQALAPDEYGFYANVNPAVDHPRWSQATERRLPSTLFRPNRIPTKLFNGYTEQVAHLYQGMDLARNY